MLVGRDLDDVVVVDDGVDDESELGRRELEDTFLDDVVTVEVVDEHNDLLNGGEVLAEARDDEIDLGVGVDGVYNFLQRAGAVLVDGDLEDVRVDALDKLSLLVRGEVLAELLDEVVAEGVENEVQEVGLDVAVHEVSDGAALLRVLKLFLQEAAAKLVGGDFDVVELIERRPGKVCGDASGTGGASGARVGQKQGAGLRA